MSDSGHLSRSLTETDEPKPREENEISSLYSMEKFTPDDMKFNIVESQELLNVIKNDWSKRCLRIKQSKTDTPSALKVPNLCNNSVWRPTNCLIRTVEDDGKCYGSIQDNNLFGMTLDGDEPAVEYDMDEQDVFWLQNLNLERKSKGMKILIEDDFEFIMDRLERGWYSISKAAQRWTSRKIESKSADNLKCDICLDGETLSHNLIVICEGCDVAVHQECYGVPLIPEGPWLCRKCYLLADGATCCLCPWKTGAFKQTTSLEKPWCHLICALFLKAEIQILNNAYKEPINILNIHHERWNLVCQACKRREGAPVQCSVRTCHTALHPKCAQFVGCELDLKEETLKCWRHSSKSYQIIEQGVIGNHGTSLSPTDRSPCPVISSKDFDVPLKSTDLSRAKYFQKPTAPAILIKSILSNYPSLLLNNPNEKNKLLTIETVAKYWSLKRQYRRGASLLKSLQVEPWTSGGILSNVSSILKQRRRLLHRLRFLEKLCMLVLQREKRKLGRISTVEEIVSISCSPFTTTLAIVLSSLKSFDSKRYFLEPVDINFVPDYYKIIQNPMWIEKIEKKLLNNDYSDFQSFKNDVELIYKNAILYNQEGDEYYCSAVEFWQKSKVVLKLAEKTLHRLKIGPSAYCPQWLENLIPSQFEEANSCNKPLKEEEKAPGELSDLLLVWAKVKGYPYYPARVVKYSEASKVERKNIPRSIIVRSKKSDNMKIIQFFDKERAWSAVKKDQLIPLNDQNFYKELQRLKMEKKLGKNAQMEIKKAFNEAINFKSNPAEWVFQNFKK